MLRRLNFFKIISGFLIVSIGIFPVFKGIAPKLSWAAENKSQSDEILLSGKNIPLKDVFKQISKDTGYEIHIRPDWSEVAVNIEAKCKSAENCLKIVLRSLKNLNWAVISQDSQKKLYVFVTGGGMGAPNKDAPVSGFSASLPEGKMKPQTMEEFLENLDPKMVEVIPPMRPGEKGVTLDQIRAARLETPVIDPKTAEVIPPLHPGEKGVTIESLETLKANQKKIDFKDYEAIPPMKPGEKGITVRDLEKLKAATAAKGGNRGFQEMPKF